MKRTTIRIDDQLFVEIKKLAAETGSTLQSVIEDSIRESLARRKLTTSSGSMTLTTFKGKGLRPGVDLDDSAALLDLMEEGDGDPH